ncbi:hypothetical protein QVD17_00072 [Tagetes erecta]|uniref:Secreted protein n=1 Tax=Tagetes erecta TaxID=13708 RepID=A0AAD8L4Y9_TARER|nr:hypothetical protein QVD17_00072 [Tagetes erecta]
MFRTNFVTILVFEFLILKIILRPPLYDRDLFIDIRFTLFSGVTDAETVPHHLFKDETVVATVPRLFRRKGERFPTSLPNEAAINGRRPGFELNNQVSDVSSK